MSEGPLWEVFVRPRPGAAHRHVGSVRAADGELALQAARDLYLRRGEGVGLWLARSADIVASQSEDAPALVEALGGKIYRNPDFYEVPAGVEHL